ncbi:hypothetical protein ES703_119946 [subsurface metagenome]
METETVNSGQWYIDYRDQHGFVSTVPLYVTDRKNYLKAGILCLGRNIKIRCVP